MAGNKRKTIFKEVKSRVHNSSTSNFHFDALDWVTQNWITELCRVTEERLIDIEKKIEDKE